MMIFHSYISLPEGIHETVQPPGQLCHLSRHVVGPQAAHGLEQVQRQAPTAAASKVRLLQDGFMRFYELLKAAFTRV